MKDTITLLEILTNTAPLVLVVIILAAILGVFLYIMIKAVIPALQEMNETFHIQRQSWKALIDEQNRINKRLTEELQNDLTEERSERVKLEKRVAELEREIEEKTRQLETANKKIAEMKKELDDVKTDREKVTKERDKLRIEVDSLHREIEELRQRLNKIPTSGDGKIKDKESEGEKKV